MQSKDCRSGAATNPAISPPEKPRGAKSGAELPTSRKQVAKAQAEINRLKKLELKEEQRLFCYKQRFFAADWHRKRCEPGSEWEIHWAGVAQSALNGWLNAASQLLAIANRKCLAEQELAQWRARAAPHSVGFLRQKSPGRIADAPNGDQGQ